MTNDKVHALSFGAAADEYERGRPGYPDAAVDWLLATAATTIDGRPGRVAATVADVGAGTGKFTASLLAHGLTVHAVEPIAEMRAVLATLPERVSTGTLTIAEGTAEALPLAAGSVDLVTVAQAWHWVDVEPASADVARVLRAGGSLALIWNIRDDSVAWVRDLWDLLGPSAAERNDSVTPAVGASIERVAYAEFPWRFEATREQVIDMVTSRSHVIVLPDEDKAALVLAIGRLLDTHPDLTGRSTFSVPYVTRVTLARRAVPVS